MKPAPLATRIANNSGMAVEGSNEAEWIQLSVSYSSWTKCV